MEKFCTGSYFFIAEMSKECHNKIVKKITIC